MKPFYIRADKGNQTTEGFNCIATSIQVNIPDGLSKEQQLEYALNYITEEMKRYFLHECISVVNRCRHGWQPEDCGMCELGVD